MVRGFSFDRAAVSPVVGTIIMVAMVVVLTGVVFIVTTQVGKSHEAPPDMAFRRHEQTDRLEIIKVAPSVARSEYEIRMSVNGDFNVDGPVGAGDDAAVAGVFVRLAGVDGAPVEGQLVPGSYISFCAETGDDGPDAVDVLVELRHWRSNSVIWHDTFFTMTDCPG